MMSQVCEQISQEREEFQGYPEYLEMVEENAAAGLLFFDSDSFAGRNAQKTRDDYEPLNVLSLEYAPSLGVTAFLNANVTDGLILILSVFLCYFFISRDKEMTVFVLFGITQKGYRRLVYERLLWLAGVVSAVAALLYLMNFCYFGALYGWDGLDRCVQSVYGMKDFVFPLSVGQYIIVFLVCKWLALLFLSLVLYTLFVLIDHPVLLSVVTAVIVVAETLLYSKIDDTSVAVAAKYINLSAVFRTTPIIAVYRNLNLWGQPVSLLWVLGVAIVLGFVCCMGLIFVGYERMKQPKERRARGARGLRGCRRVHSLPYYEWYKLLRLQKVLILLVGFSAVCVLTFHPKEIYYHRYLESAYKQYMTALSGYPSATKNAFLNKEQEQYRTLALRLSSVDETDMETRYEITQQMQEKECLYEVIGQYEYVKSRSNRQMVYDSGYQWLMGEQGTTRTLLLLAVLFGMTVFCTSGLFVNEKVSGMDDLIAATYHGVINIYDLKRVIALLLYTLVYCVLFGIRLVSIGMVYGYPMLTADANSLMMFSYLPDGWSVELVICLLHLWYYFVGYLLLQAVLRISRQSRTRMGAMLASLGAALLVWLVLAGISVLV
jgi:hypothetical protein